MARPADKRRRLLLRLKADLRQVSAEIEHFQAQSRALLRAETVRTLRPEEAKQQRALFRKSVELHARLRQLWSEFGQVQRGGKG